MNQPLTRNDLQRALDRTEVDLSWIMAGYMVIFVCAGIALLR
jgi:hypothetical protein